MDPDSPTRRRPSKKYSVVVVGGGAAGFFSAIAAKKKHPQGAVAIIEKNAALLSKVRISGGGRCNVTHACFEPRLLVQNYPRGSKELLGPFFRFQPKDTIQWFESKQVQLKAEPDGRMFPISDNSETIINCLLKEAEEVGVEVHTQRRIESVTKIDEGFYISFKKGLDISTQNLIFATGSSPAGHQWAQELGHAIEPLVPSLFTFNMPNSPLAPLSGISFADVEVKIKDTKLSQRGPLLITHFGLSGPAVLKLSAWGARILHEKNYQFKISIHWLPNLSQNLILEHLEKLKESKPQKMLISENLFNFPKNFWKTFLKQFVKIDQKRLSDISSKELLELSKMISADEYSIQGKTTHKEEFVTCGGVRLKEVDFKTMESKCCKCLFFAGEILDVDGITGGFNFQNAWTTGYIAGNSTQ